MQERWRFFQTVKLKDRAIDRKLRYRTRRKPLYKTASCGEVDCMNWYGNYEDGWINKETGEKIVFKEREEYNVWLYKTEEQRRGQKVASGQRKKEVLQEAKEVAEEYEETSWW